MKKYKSLVFAVQTFCFLLLVLSELLERSLTQLAYCFTAFSSPFLILSFGEEAFSSKTINWGSVLIFIVETFIGTLFVWTAIYGMQLGEEAFQGFMLLLVTYCLVALLSIIDCICSRNKRRANA